MSYNRARAVKATFDEAHPKRPGLCSMCGERLPAYCRRWCGACGPKAKALQFPDIARRMLWRIDPRCALCRANVYVPMRGVTNGGCPLGELDHVVPLCEGGRHEWSNVRLICAPCHRVETGKLAARLAERRRGAEVSQ